MTAMNSHMNRDTFEALVLSFFLACVCGAATAWADRSDVWLASTVQVKAVNLLLLDDGGCAVSATARYAKSDGGPSTETTGFVAVSGANRTTCLDIINNKAPALFKADRGL